jgi:hypothetical protein
MTLIITIALNITSSSKSELFREYVLNKNKTLIVLLKINHFLQLAAHFGISLDNSRKRKKKLTDSFFFFFQFYYQHLKIYIFFYSEYCLIFFQMNSLIFKILIGIFFIQKVNEFYFSANTIKVFILFNYKKFKLISHANTLRPLETFEDKKSFEQFKHKIKTNADIFWSRIISKIDTGKDIIKIRKFPKESSPIRQESVLNGVWYVLGNILCF